MRSLYIRFSVITLVVLLSGCRSQQSVVDTGIISYDPPGATTQTRELDPHHSRTIGITATGIWVSNEFDGGRLSDFYHLENNRYRAEIYPENAPINRSAWYAFKIWSEIPQTVEIELTYRDGQHRYIPKLSRDQYIFTPIDSLKYTHNRESGSATLILDVDDVPLWVSAQELYTSAHFKAWFDTLSTIPFVQYTTVGTSIEGRDIDRIIINETGDPDVPMMIITGRQHPPEVPGALAQRVFIETILGDDPIAVEYRKRFQVVAYPLMNPDGVDNGHWRHNMGGVDLNRDWRDFNQPETRAVSNDLLQFRDRGVKALYSLDFHSTSYDVYYTMRRDVPTNYPHLSDAWLEGIAARVPGYVIREEPSGAVAPIQKNWMYHTFNVDGVTYEVGDNTPRPLLRQVAEAAALSLMEELLKLDL